MGPGMKKNKSCELLAFTDCDWAACIDDKKSTIGYVFCLGREVC